MKKLIPVFLLLLAVSSVLIFFIIRHGDKQRIHRNLVSLAAMLSKSDKESELVALADIQRIKPLFTKDCRIAAGAPLPEIIGPDELVSTIHQAQRMVSRIAIDFYDISVIIGKKQLTARTIMTATATGPGPRGGKSMTEAREVEMRWKKVAGVWKIAEVRFIKILR